MLTSLGQAESTHPMNSPSRPPCRPHTCRNEGQHPRQKEKSDAGSQRLVLVSPLCDTAEYPGQFDHPRIGNPRGHQNDGHRRQNDQTTKDPHSAINAAAFILPETLFIKRSRE